MKTLRCHGFDADSKRELSKDLKQKKNMIRFTFQKDSLFYQLYRERV